MTRLLAIETSSAACSAALSIDGRVEERHALAPRQHASLILPMIESLLVEAGLRVGELDACAFGCGPGSFTGVRIAASVIQGIAFAVDLPVVPVSTLAVLAQGGMRETGQAHMLAALDARKDEVYWGAYRQSGSDRPELLGEERVCAPADIDMPAGSDWVGVGSGWAAHGEVLAAQAGERLVRLMHDLEPRARDVATIAMADFRAGRTVAAADAIPVYLRNRVADERKA
ncbi:MAG: tRNA (adenosine(37)-N6)-threonylcarbamoyltransferase complex dimerization subunit type 1 TsaB [Gammaproteobacteria bacterium]|nr:tRNA (adenosine(37)-N6)-threonylcarbamoyltransferase complex dimerization subunit type 1 TsaB [Gammaproteobacteria bacterium]